MRPFGSKQLEVERDIPFIFALDFVFLHKRNRPFCVKFSEDIAWESEVWIADAPDHMIHFNGYKYLEINK